jgi:hypothetical protein
MKSQMHLIVTFLFLLFASKSFSQDTLDYGDPQNWAVRPGAYPEQLLEFGTKDPVEGVDVFYVYPTLLLAKDDQRWNVTVDDPKHRKDVLETAVKFQASAWSAAGSVYVPFYRQAHIRAYYNLENGGREALLKAYGDVKAAFQYYLEHHNNGRGIILAGHSQGGTHLSLLLKDFFDGTQLQERLVAAYMPGIGLDSNHYQHISLMSSPAETGGFVTWNTFKKKFDKDQYKWYKGKAVVNPVSWDTTNLSLRSEHKGFLFSNGKLYGNSFDTHVDDGVIWISKPHFPFRYLSFTMKNYHIGDVNLFWEDIRLNAIIRSSAYIRKRSVSGSVNWKE